MRNRAAVLYAPHDVRMEERPMPQAGPKDVLVEVKAVGVCGSDVHYYEHGRIGPYIVRQPLILGHESAGAIVAVGADVHQSRIGERVAIEPGIPDGTCEQCRTVCRSIVRACSLPTKSRISQDRHASTTLWTFTRSCTSGWISS